MLYLNKTQPLRAEVLAKCQYFKLRNVDSQREVNTGWRRVQEAWLSRSGQVSDDHAEPPVPGADPASTTPN